MCKECEAIIRRANHDIQETDKRYQEIIKKKVAQTTELLNKCPELR